MLLLYRELTSSDVRERHTLTRSETFPLSACFCFSKRIGKAFVLVFSGVRYKCDGVNKRQKRNIQLPVTVRGKRTTLLKVPQFRFCLFSFSSLRTNES